MGACDAWGLESLSGRHSCNHSVANSCRADSITWDMVAKEAATGKAYLHEHTDVNGQPVIVIRSSLHKTGIADIHCKSTLHNTCSDSK